MASLPEDILRQILQHFGKPSASKGWVDRAEIDGDCLRTLQNVRLACRILSNIATPLLFSVLHVSIDYKSVEAFEQLCNNPLIADCARGVVVNLAAYSRELAENPSKFREQKYHELDGSYGGLDYNMEFRYDADAEDVKEYHRISDEMICLYEIWMDTGYHESETRAPYRHIEYNDTDGEKKREYRDVLRNSYKEYARRYNEQMRALQDATVMQRLAKAFSKLSCGGRVHFSDKVERGLSDDSYGLDIADLMNNVSQHLFRAMIQPYQWQELDQHDTQNTLEIVSALSLLPIAISEAGATMTEVHIGCFPHYGSFFLLFRGSEQKRAKVKQKLQQAYQSLETFHFPSGGMSCKGLRYHPLSDEDQSYMNDYIQAALSGRRLQNLSLDLCTYGILGESEDHDCDLGPMLQQCTSSQLRRLCISNFRCRHQEIEPIISGLGDYLQFLHLHSIDLLDGDWASLLDEVHQKVGRRCQEGRCKAMVSSLLGGEYGREKKPHVDWFTMRNMSEDELAAARGKPKIIQASEEYICGARTGNPLRGLHLS